MPKLELTNMVMIQDKDTGKVLVQDRVKSWKGLSFPGGHVEECESFIDSAIREVKEETGLDVRNLQSCGVIHLLHKTKFDRYVVFLYKTSDFSGELITECDEGRHFWMTLDKLRAVPSQNDTPKFLPMFLEGKYSEAFGFWHEDEAWELIYQ